MSSNVYFECFKCGKEFDDIKFVILHLKLNHFIKDDIEPMKCLLAGNVCTEEFYHFNKLKAHSKKCRPTLVQNHKPKYEFRPKNLEQSLESVHISECVRKN